MRTLKKSPADEDNNKITAATCRNANRPSKGEATSFGFRRPTIAQPKAATCDTNGNEPRVRPLSASRLPAPKKDGSNTQPVSRFGFRQARRVGDVATTPPTLALGVETTRKTPIAQSRPNDCFARKEGSSGKFTLQYSNLPRPQPICLLDTKAAKTLANNNVKKSTNRWSSKEARDGSLTEDSGIGSHNGADNDSFGSSKMRCKCEPTLIGQNFDMCDLDGSNQSIAPLPELPSAFGHADNDRFLIKRDIVDSNKETTRSPIKRFSTSSPKSKTPPTFIKPNAKLSRYSSTSSSDEPEIWGSTAGEAMADKTALIPKKEQHAELHLAFRAIADTRLEDVAKATQNDVMLDDETSPSPVASDASFDAKHNSPASVGTPTQNSLSISEGKDDFLIDDEISDQPALVFQQTQKARPLFLSSEKSTPGVARKRLGLLNVGLKNLNSIMNSATSLDTLSPSESVFSDDLMLDFEISQGSDADDDFRSDPVDAFNSPFKTPKSSKYERERFFDDKTPSILSLNENLKQSLQRSKNLGSKSSTPNVTDSPNSGRLTRRTAKPPSIINSPLRIRKTASSPLQNGYDSDDSIRLSKNAHASLRQNIVTVKTDLVKLWRILNGSEAHNPFINQSDFINGIFNTLTNKNIEVSGENFFDNEIGNSELTELRRQVLFMQGLLDDKEKAVENLQAQLSMMNRNGNLGKEENDNERGKKASCNAATQTDRIRAATNGTTISDNDTAGSIGTSLVSVTELKKLTSPSMTYKRTLKTLGKSILPTKTAKENSPILNAQCTTRIK